MGPRLAFTLRAFAAKLRGFFGGQQHDNELDSEIKEHLQMLTDRFAAQGMSKEDAAREARRKFGNTILLQEERRELQTLTSIEALWLDLRYALRTLWKNRAFALVSIATLGLGIGAATAIFSVVDNVLLAPFPYPDGNRIVFPRIVGAQQTQDDGRQGYTANEVLELMDNNHVFDGTAAAEDKLLLYKYGEGTEQLDGASVTPGTFEFFGMPALHGRVLQPADYEPGAPPVFVMGYKIWQEKFGGDLSILNKPLVLNGTARTLVGIMPRRFGWYGVDAYIPEKLSPTTGSSDSPFWFFVGRLKPGVSMEQAQADLTLIARRLAKIYPQNYPAQFTLVIKHLGDTVIGRFKETLYVALAAVGLLLLIACSNVANLLLARATTREKEFALRSALGAKRARLIRLLMFESLVLAAAGAALGVLFAWGGLKAVVAAMPADFFPAESVIQLNTPVLGFTLAVAALTALVFGLAPALQSSGRDINDSLRDSGKGVSGGFRGRLLRDVIVVGEVALSLTLLIGAGLLMRSFVALREINLGVRTDHLLFTVVVLPPDRYKTTEQVTNFFRPLLARLKTSPGVIDASESTSVPPFNFQASKIEIAGKAHQEDWQADFQGVSEEYFDTLRIPLKEGRRFDEAEVNSARKVIVVNETFVRKFLGTENPIGQQVRLLRSDIAPNASFEIVGVAGDVINNGLQTPIEPEVWLPYTIDSSRQILIVRTAQDPATMMELVRKEIWTADSGIALADTNTLEGRLRQYVYAGPRFGFVVMTIFGCIGLILVTVGVYSVLAYSTARKTHEIGIRMALGAQGGDVLGLVVGTGLRLVIVGMAIGIAISLTLGRIIATELVGVKAYDPATLAGTTLLLVITAAAASWIPARRAAKVDPMIALRYE
jgi:putative ABC transport system permease protein